MYFTYFLISLLISYFVYMTLSSYKATHLVNNLGNNEWNWMKIEHNWWYNNIIFVDESKW